jgi:succinate dehydrogenase/fumarate reductase flavoprotein subunit
LRRNESRGLHFTTDYPSRDDEHWLHDTVVSVWDAEAYHSTRIENLIH